MRQERKALNDMKINGSLFIYNPKSLNMVTDGNNFYCVDNMTH